VDVPLTFVALNLYCQLVLEVMLSGRYLNVKSPGSSSCSSRTTSFLSARMPTLPSSCAMRRL